MARRMQSLWSGHSRGRAEVGEVGAGDESTARGAIRTREGRELTPGVGAPAIRARHRSSTLHPAIVCRCVSEGGFLYFLFEHGVHEGLEGGLACCCETPASVGQRHSPSVTTLFQHVGGLPTTICDCIMIGMKIFGSGPALRRRSPAGQRRPRSIL